MHRLLKKAKIAIAKEEEKIKKNEKKKALLPRTIAVTSNSKWIAHSRISRTYSSQSAFFDFFLLIQFDSLKVMALHGQACSSTALEAICPVAEALLLAAAGTKMTFSQL